ncbi:MAG: proton-conducting transporter membrane subunit [Planctomycetota bacterium]
MSETTSNLIVLMIAVPMAMGLLCVPLVNFPKVCRAIGLLSFGGTFTLSVVLLTLLTRHDTILASQMGGWAAPYGITLVFDSLSGLMLAAASLVALGTFVHGFGSLSPRTERRYFHPLVNLMMFGVNLSFLTGDLFNLFVAFEVMLMASYGLLVIGGGKAQLRHAYKYVVLNLLASSVFVIAAGMAYGMFGTLNMADLSRIVTGLAAEGALPPGFTALGVLFLFVFTLKAGVFPLWFWLPDTYPTCPISITALFGGVLTKVGLYAIARTFPLIFFVGPGADRVLVPLLAVGAAMTMLVGVLGALAYSGLRRVLCLMLIVGVGYALLGITVNDAGGLSGSAFYMAQSMIVMAALFLCCGMLERVTGTDETGRMGALLQNPKLIWLGVMLFVGLVGVVGLPPTSGFYGKLVIVRESLNERFWLVGVTALVVGGLTLLAAIRVWGTTFWGPEPPPEARQAEGDNERKPAGKSEWLGAALLTVAALGVGFVAEPVLSTATTAGQQLADPAAYVDAVLHNPAYAEARVAADYDGHTGSAYGGHRKTIEPHHAEGHGHD